MADKYNRSFLSALAEYQRQEANLWRLESSNFALEIQTVQEIVRVVVPTHRRCIEDWARVVHEAQDPGRSL